MVMLCVSICAFSQTETPTDTLPDPEKEQARAMIEAVEYYFNLLGSKRTKTREKETIINESYKKLFLDDRVQVEDDLQEDRSTQIFKDIQAYLKDIDFFFKEVVFDFEINAVERLYTADSTPYFKADITRNLNAIGIADDTLKISGQRFIELNFDGPQREVKVASIYTNKIDRERQLRAWWQNLSVGWKQIFQDEIGIYDDSLTVDELTRIAEMDSLDLTDNDQVVNLDPIYVLTDLSYLKLSNSFITDLSPLLSINRLKVLDIAQTSVHDLSALKYHTDIENMVLHSSHVTDFSVLGFFEKLKRLNLMGSQFDDLSFISSLTALTDLNLNDATGTNSIDYSGLLNLQRLDLDGSDINSLNGFEGLSQLLELSLVGTSVNSVENLAGLQGLARLNISNTQVNDITPLVGIKALSRVYIEGLSLEGAQVDDFVSNNDALLIRDLAVLAAWWEGLSPEWQTLLATQLNKTNPSTEELVRLLDIDKLDAKSAGIRSLGPVSRLTKLITLDASDNNIASLAGVDQLTELTNIRFNNTNVTDLSPLKFLTKLETIEAENTRVREVRVLNGLTKLNYLNVDGASLSKSNASALMNAIPGLKLQFQTGALRSWWNGLSENMKGVFRQNASIAAQPTSDELHALMGIESIEVNGSIDASDLKSLEELVNLKSLMLSRTGLTSLAELPNIQTLTSLSITQTPFNDLNSVLKFEALTALNISNTAVTDLSPLSVMIKLKKVNFSGTTVKRLRGLERLVNLEVVDCSNTRVTRLDGLFLLPELKQVICFNSKLNGKDIQSLKSAQPKVEVVFY